MRRRADRPRPQHQLVGIWNASRPAGRRGRSVAGTSRPAPRAYRCLRRRRQSEPLCATFIAGWRAASRPREPDPASGRPSAGHSSPLSRRSNASPLYELFNGILNPKEIEGLRLLVTPFPQQQFNQTEDRRSEKASRGVTCFDCHANGHTNAATHLSGDVRPQELRHRIDTPPLRGVNIQRLFGSQRALKTVEDFTEFEQRGAYFDGDPVHRHEEGRQHPGARQPGAFHGRVPGAARLSAGAQARHVRQARSRARRPRPNCAAKRCSSARANARPATRRRTTPTT